MCAPAETREPTSDFPGVHKEGLELIVGEIAANPLALWQQLALLVVVVVRRALRHQSEQIHHLVGVVTQGVRIHIWLEKIAGIIDKPTGRHGRVAVRIRKRQTAGANEAQRPSHDDGMRAVRPGKILFDIVDGNRGAERSGGGDGVIKIGEPDDQLSLHPGVVVRLAA